MRSLFISLILFTSCVDSSSPEVRDEEAGTADMSLVLTDPQPESSKWICYHPQTDFHNRECVEKYYPEGCYVLGDSGKFCWLLVREDCEGEISGNVLDSCKNAGYLQ